MDMTTTTRTSAATTSSAAAASSMASMDMGGGMDGECKISMLWNWYTIDACFLSSQWHITSAATMAGSCIGVICLVIVLEGLRRAAREYDASISRQAVESSSYAGTADGLVEQQETNEAVSNPKNPIARVRTTTAPSNGPTSFTPTLPRQIIRATLHMLQFAVAYFIMLLAMYFNGYIIISIFIGAFIGSFMFSWQKLAVR